MGQRLDLHFGSASGNTDATYLVYNEVRTAATLTEGDTQIHPPIPRGRRWKLNGIRVTCSAAPGAGDTDTFTVRRNASDTSFTVDVAGASATTGWGTSGVTPVVYAATDLISVLYNATGTPDASTKDVILEGEVV